MEEEEKETEEETKEEDSKDSFRHQHTYIKYNKFVRELLKKGKLKKKDLSYIQDRIGYGVIKKK